MQAAEEGWQAKAGGLTGRVHEGGGVWHGGSGHLRLGLHRQRGCDRGGDRKRQVSLASCRLLGGKDCSVASRQPVTAGSPTDWPSQAQLATPHPPTHLLEERHLVAIHRQGLSHHLQVQWWHAGRGWMVATGEGSSGLLGKKHRQQPLATLWVHPSGSNTWKAEQPPTPPPHPAPAAHCHSSPGPHLRQLLVLLLLLGGAACLAASSGARGAACGGICCLCKLRVGKEPLHGHLHMVGILQGGRRRGGDGEGGRRGAGKGQAIVNFIGNATQTSVQLPGGWGRQRVGEADTQAGLPLRLHSKIAAWRFDKVEDMGRTLAETTPSRPP